MVIIGEWSFYNNLRISCQCTLSRKLLNHLVTAVTRVFLVFGTGICTEATEQSSKSTQNVHDIINHDIYSIIHVCMIIFTEHKLMPALHWISKTYPWLENLLPTCLECFLESSIMHVIENDHIMHDVECIHNNVGSRGYFISE